MKTKNENHKIDVGRNKKKIIKKPKTKLKNQKKRTALLFCFLLIFWRWQGRRTIRGEEKERRTNKKDFSPAHGYGNPRSPPRWRLCPIWRRRNPIGHWSWGLQFYNIFVFICQFVGCEWWRMVIPEEANNEVSISLLNQVNIPVAVCSGFFPNFEGKGFLDNSFEHGIGALQQERWEKMTGGKMEEEEEKEEERKKKIGSP